MCLNAVEFKSGFLQVEQVGIYFIYMMMDRLLQAGGLSSNVEKVLNSISMFSCVGTLPVRFLIVH